MNKGKWYSPFSHGHPPSHYIDLCLDDVVTCTVHSAVYKQLFHPTRDIAVGVSYCPYCASSLRDSQRYCGVHHVSWYNMGVCYFYLSHLEQVGHGVTEPQEALVSDIAILHYRRRRPYRHYHEVGREGNTSLISHMANTNGRFGM